MENNQRGQSLIEALIISTCLLPLVFCFFQVMLFFGYQHLSNFLAHETLICLQENANSKSSVFSSPSSCTQRLERTLQGVLIWTKEHRVQIKSGGKWDGQQTRRLDLQWKLGWIYYHKIF